MSEATAVVNKRHGVAFDVYIGRGSLWGNPYPIGPGSDREAVIRRYEDHLRSSPKLLAAVEGLHGKSLGCFCAPAPCHGDILAAFADSFSESGRAPESSVSDGIFTEPKRPRLEFD